MEEPGAEAEAEAGGAGRVWGAKDAVGARPRAQGVHSPCQERPSGGAAWPGRAGGPWHGRWRCQLIPAAGPQPEQEALGAGSPAFGEEEEEEKDLNKALGVERFEEILNDAHPRNAEEAGRSYGEEDFECERGQGWARSRERAGSGRGEQGVGNWQEMGRERSTDSRSPQSTASRPTTSTTRSPRTCPPTPAARRGSRKRAKRRPGVPLSPERPPPSRKPKRMRMRRATQRRSARRRSCGSLGQPRLCR